MDAFRSLISLGRRLDATFVPAAVLFGFGLVFGALGARLLEPA